VGKCHGIGIKKPCGRAVSKGMKKIRHWGLWNRAAGGPKERGKKIRKGVLGKRFRGLGGDTLGGGWKRGVGGWGRKEELGGGYQCPI